MELVEASIVALVLLDFRMQCFWSSSLGPGWAETVGGDFCGLHRIEWK